MQVEIKIDSGQQTQKVVVIADAITEEVNEIVRRLSEESPKIITGFSDDKVTILEASSISRVYANNGKVYAVTKEREYVLRLRLYEAEERLNRCNFVRISNSELINLDWVKNFDLSFVGTICVLICQMIAIFISFAIHDGNYYAVVPELADICGGETMAVLVQAIFACVYGAVWAGIYLMIWITQYYSMKKKIQKKNRKIQEVSK